MFVALKTLLATAVCLSCSPFLAPLLATPVISTALPTSEISEGMGGQVFVTVLLSEPAESDVTVEYTTVAGSASVTDFTPVSGTLTIGADATQGTVAIPITDDSVFETLRETFIVQLSSPVGADLGTAQTEITIIDNERLELAIGGSAVARPQSGAGETLSFPISFRIFFTTAVELLEPLEIPYTIHGLNAVSGIDFTGESGTLSLPATGDESTAWSLDVPVPAGDQSGDRSLLASLTSDSERVSFTNANALGTIQGNRSAVTVSSSPVRANESGDAALTFAIRLSEALLTTQDVTYTTRDGSATAGTDYTATSGTLTFAAGETSKEVSVPLIDDSIFEGGETLFLDLAMTGGSVVAPEKWLSPALLNPAVRTNSQEVLRLATDENFLAVVTGRSFEPSSVWLFQLGATGRWQLIKQIEPPDWFATTRSTLTGFGDAISLEGGILAVGSPRLNPAGRTLPDPIGGVAIYEIDAGGAGNWGLTTVLKSAITADSTLQNFGDYVALGENTLAVGVPANGFLGVDRVQLFARDLVSEGWEFLQELTGSTLRSGFGQALSFDGERLAVGAPDDNDGAGAVTVYEKDASGVWAAGQKLSPVPLGARARFGAAVEFENGRLVANVGMSVVDSLDFTGIIEFTEDAGIWSIGAASLSEVTDEAQDLRLESGFTTSGSSTTQNVFTPSGRELLVTDSRTQNGVQQISVASTGIDTSQINTDFSGNLEADAGILSASLTFNRILAFQKAHATATIIDDETAATIPTLSIATTGSTTVTEPATGSAVVATLAISLSEPAATTIVVRYESSDGAATAYEDYSPLAGDVTFAIGEMEKLIPVTLLADSARENRQAETFSVSILSSTPLVTTTQDTVEFTILDTTAAFGATADSYTISQGETLVADGSRGAANAPLTANDPNAQFATIGDLPALGTASIESSIALIYSPPSLNFIGDETFTYTARRGSDISNPALITVTVADSMIPPTIRGDDYARPRGTRLFDSSALGNLSAYANDSLLDANGIAYDPILSVVLTGTDKDQVTSFDAQTGHFTADLGDAFTGIFEFAYQVEDKDGISNEAATVRITAQEVTALSTNLALQFPQSAGVHSLRGFQTEIAPGFVVDFPLEFEAGVPIAIEVGGSVEESLQINLTTPDGISLFSQAIQVAPGGITALPLIRTTNSGAYLLSVQRPTGSVNSIITLDISAGAIPAAPGIAAPESAQDINGTFNTRGIANIVGSGMGSGEDWFTFSPSDDDQYSIAVWQTGANRDASVAVFSASMEELGTVQEGETTGIMGAAAPVFLRVSGSDYYLLTVVKNGTLADSTGGSLDPVAAGGRILGHFSLPSTTATFSVFGDYGDDLSNPNPDLVAAMVKSWDPDYIVAAGDHNYGDTRAGSADWDRLVGSRYGSYMLGREDDKYPLQTSTIQRFFPVVGNHDTDAFSSPSGSLGGGTVKGYLDYFVNGGTDGAPRLSPGGGEHTERASYYDFYWGDIHMIMADSDLGDADAEFAREQNRWIDQTLRGSSGRWKFVVFHQPPYSSALHGNHEYLQGPHLAQADAVFSAHDHVYERIERDGTVFFTSGLGGRDSYSFNRPYVEGSEARYNRRNGAIRVRVTPSGTDVEFIHVEPGTIEDRTIDTKRLIPSELRIQPSSFTFETTAGQEFSFVATGDGSGNPALVLRTPDSTIVATSTFSEGSARLSHTAAISGSYFLDVSNIDGSPGNFELTYPQLPQLPMTAYEIWLVEQFGSNADPAISGDTADGDGDGLPVFLEYAIGSDPNDSNSRLETTIAANSSTISINLEFPDELVGGLIYKIETSERLASGWIPISTRSTDGAWNSSENITTTDLDTSIQIDDSRELLSEQLFYRLSVSTETATP